MTFKFLSVTARSVDAFRFLLQLDDHAIVVNWCHEKFRSQNKGADPLEAIKKNGLCPLDGLGVP